MTTAIENQPIIIDLGALALSSGWTVSGQVATHDSCNAGNIYIINYPLISGQTYTYSWQVITCTSGFVQANLGTAQGAAQTSPNILTETITATGTNPQFFFFSNGNCSIQNFTISLVAVQTSPTQQNTISFSEKTKKWGSFYSYIPDNAFSLFTDTFSFYHGGAYLHEQGQLERCNFYGVQYPATIFISTNEQPTVSKTFIAVNYQANQLLVAPSIQTSTGQFSELFTGNFIQEQYNNGQIIYSSEGLYKASFLRDMTVDIINGPQLKGNWLTMALVTTSPSTPMNMFSSEINYVHSYQNIR